MKCSVSDKGFTLLELMIAISVCSALMLICGVILRMGSADRSSMSRELSWERQASLVVDHLNRDLMTAHRRLWYERDGQDSCQFGWYVLRSITGQPEAEAISDLCAVGYALGDVVVDVKNGTKQRCLLRVERDSRQVHQMIQTGKESELWALDEAAEILANGVLDFELRPMLQDGSDHWQPWIPVSQTMPEAVELRLVLVSPSLQKRLTTSEAWDQAQANVSQWNGSEIRELKTLIYLGPDAD